MELDLPVIQFVIFSNLLPVHEMTYVSSRFLC